MPRRNGGHQRPSLPNLRSRAREIMKYEDALVGDVNEGDDVQKDSSS
jgi:hypothetical protein